MKTLRQMLVEASAPQNPVTEFCLEFAPHKDDVYHIERNQFFKIMDSWFKDPKFRKAYGLEKILKADIKKNGSELPMIFLMRYISDPRYNRGFKWVMGINLPSVDKSVRIAMEGGFLWNENATKYDSGDRNGWVGTTDVTKQKASVILDDAGPWYSNLKEATAYKIPESMEKAIIDILKL